MTIPVINSGAFTLFVQANVYGQIYESDTTNNVAALALSTFILQPPDLVPLSVTAPATVDSSQPHPVIEMTWVVTNQGTGLAPSGWWERVWFSTNGVLDRQSVDLGDYMFGYTLPAGASYPQTVDVTLPVTNNLTYTLFVQLNIYAGTGYNSIHEPNLSNNISAGVPGTFSLAPPPDLALISAAAPATVISSQPNPVVQVTWAVTNQGTALAPGGWYDRVWFSANGVLDANSRDLGDFYRSQSLPAGASYTQTNNVTLPMSASGTYTLFVQVDVYNSVFELNKANNVSAPVTGTVRLTLPDLQVLSVSVPQQAWTGRSFDVSWVLTNAGTGTATGPWIDQFYLSSTNQLRTNQDQVIGTFPFEGQLPPGQAVQLIQRVLINRAGITNGRYYVTVFADAGNNVLEATKTNNVGISSSNMLVEPTPLSDLAVSLVAAPTNGFGGQPVGVSWVVCNQGQADTDVPVWYDHLYLSTTPNLAGVVQDFGEYENPSYLAVGDCYQQDATVTLPVGISGPFYFIVDADATGLVGGDSITNTLGSTALPIDIQLVTAGFLHVASVEVAPAPPTAVWAGDSVTVTWTVQNIGQTSITGTWDDEVTLSPTPVYDYVNGYWDVINHIYFNGPLAPGQSYSHTNQFTALRASRRATGMLCPSLILTTSREAPGPSAVATSAAARILRSSSCPRLLPRTCRS